MKLTELSAGKPALWKSNIYGNVAVHVASVHHGIVKVTVDGEAAARQVIDHPELLEGWFVIPKRLHKRESKPRKAPVRALAEQAGLVKNTIREVPGIGKVAVITNDPPKTTAQRNKRRLSMVQALNEARSMADRNSTHFQWAQPSAVEEF